MKLETKYGILDVREDSKGAIHINFYSDNHDSMVLEMKNSNSLILHIVNDETTEVRTITSLKPKTKIVLNK